MSGTAGDAHIWTVSNGAVPVAVCGYTPALDEDNMVQHAEPTGDTCDDCVVAAAAEPEPEA
jgi:hypothetical protein